MTLDIHILNAGKGDSIVLHAYEAGNDHFAVIDSNYTGSGEPPALTKLNELGAKSLSFVCMTHPHQDHYKGLLQILKHFSGKVERFYTCPLDSAFSSKATLKKYIDQFRKFIARTDDEDVAQNCYEFIGLLVYAHENFKDGMWQELSGPNNYIPPEFCGARLVTLMPPPRAKSTQYIARIRNGSIVDPETPHANKLSLGFIVSYAGRDVLLAGDVDNDNWEYHRRIYKTKTSADIVKLPHHGSKYECNDDNLPMWFAKESKIAIISANGTKHPDEEVLSWLMDNNVKTYCTNLSRKWAGGKLADFINTSCVDPELGRRIRQLASSDSKQPCPCKGNICVSISDNGSINVSTQYSNSCGCDFSALDDLFRLENRDVTPKSTVHV